VNKERIGELERIALSVNLVSSGQFRVLNDEIVTTRNVYQCAICDRTIPIGSRVRSIFVRSTGYRTRQSLRHCSTCITATASLVAAMCDKPSLYAIRMVSQGTWSVDQAARRTSPIDQTRRADTSPALDRIVEKRPLWKRMFGVA
jgi:hypothetical protein